MSATKVSVKFSVVKRSHTDPRTEPLIMVDLQETGLPWLHAHQDGQEWTMILADKRFEPSVAQDLMFIWKLLVLGHRTELRIVEEWNAEIVDDSMYPIIRVNISPDVLIDGHLEQDRLFGYRYCILPRGTMNAHDPDRLNTLRREGLHHVYGEFCPNHNENLLILTDKDMEISKEDAQRLVKIRGIVADGDLPRNVLSTRRNANGDLIIELV